MKQNLFLLLAVALFLYAAHVRALRADIEDRCEAVASGNLSIELKEKLRSTCVQVLTDSRM